MPNHQVIVFGLEPVVGAKSKRVVFAFGRGIDPAPLIAAERPLGIVIRDDVLPQLGADPFEQISKVPDDRKVPNDGVAFLHEIVCHEGHQDDPQHDDRP